MQYSLQNHFETTSQPIDDEPNLNPKTNRNKIIPIVGQHQRYDFNILFRCDSFNEYLFEKSSNPQKFFFVNTYLLSSTFSKPAKSTLLFLCP